jgi:hypothetical protein
MQRSNLTAITLQTIALTRFSRRGYYQQITWLTYLVVQWKARSAEEERSEDSIRRLEGSHSSLSAVSRVDKLGSQGQDPSDEQHERSWTMVDDDEIVDVVIAISQIRWSIHD